MPTRPNTILLQLAALTMAALLQPAGATPAAAQQNASPPTLTRAADASPGAHQAHIKCTCRAAGQDHVVGTTICLGNTLHRCGMDLNVTSWQSAGEACPQS